MLFAHLALDQLRPGGAHAFVAPAYWLRGAGPGPRHLRARLDADARWRALVDLGRLDRFEGGGAGARAIVYVVDRPGPVDVRAEGRPVDV
ncbi:MAG: hypothetical protein KF878_32180 [Planctomycetes bacterium]|nr:hypothetical protein [Planctomycetota bacterium]